MVTLVRPLQPENAEYPMLVTLSPMVTLVRPLQPENAEPPMLVTLLPMATLVRPLQPENAEFPMPRIPAKSKSPEGDWFPMAQPSTKRTPGMLLVS